MTKPGPKSLECDKSLTQISLQTATYISAADTSWILSQAERQPTNAGRRYPEQVETSA